jgi:SNF2 family DNA or RNA helicase
MNETNLHNYQGAAVTHIADNPFCGLFLDMGLGKTVSTLTAINNLTYKELDISKTLVIAPKRVAETVWSNEIEKWDHLKHLKISKVIGSPSKRLGALAVKADIYLISRDNIAWLCGLYGGSKLPFDMLVIDESSSFKSPNSQRFKALRKVQPSLNRVVLLTGTPAPNGLIDLWSQLYLLDRGERLGRTLTNYRQEYFNEGKRNGAIVYNYNLRKGSDEAIHEQIDDICLSMKAEDYLDMPEKIINKVVLELPADIKKQYQDFEKSQILSLLDTADDEGEISAVNAAALSNKLLQFANGAVYDENRDVHEVHRVKLEAIEEIIENANGKPVLIAWTYKHDESRMLEALKKYKPVQFKTDAHYAAWNRGEIQVMMMHPASGGHGLNLQAGGNIVVWFGQTWSLELYQQLNARLLRQGQEAESVIFHHLVTAGTLDEDVLKSLDSKDQKQEGLMQAIKARIEKYEKQY